MWVARDKNNTLAVFIDKPIRIIKDDRGENYWTCSGYSHGMWMYLYNDMFQDLTWEDEPIEVNLFSKDDKFNLIDSILDYINRFGLKESSTSGIYEHLFADVTEK